MSLEKIEHLFKSGLKSMKAGGIIKGKEKVITAITKAENGYGPRYLLEGEGNKPFLRMNSNSYLGFSLNWDIIEAEEEAVRKLGAGPGAVRFISGTYRPHVELEERLADFHAREAAMTFSAAYSAVMGILPQLITEETLVVSDELNHNCIINAIKLARPAKKTLYRHLDMKELEGILKENAGKFRRAVVVTDGIFSMRGDFAPLDEIAGICRKHESMYEEGIITVADDSHGVGAFGGTGRGTEEHTGARIDILIATLGKALGVNGGYVVSSRIVIDYLRETAPFYIYSNPITPAEAAAAVQSLEILGGPEGRELLERLQKLRTRLEKGIKSLGFETIPGEHPITPLMIRDTEKTVVLTNFLYEKGILATGLYFPVVPRGDEEIRFQVCASHMEKDIDYVLAILGEFSKRVG